MKIERTILSVIVACILLTTTFISIPVAVNAGMPKIITGWVEQNSTYGVRAWDATQNGDTAFYLQSWRNNGTSTDVMKDNKTAGTTDYYEWEAGSKINYNDNNHGDPSVVIINREDGSGPTRAGYVAYTSAPLPTVTVFYPTCELQKIPVPTLDINGTDFINITWPDLPDSLGLIAGYTVYRSTDNSSWSLVSGDKDNPVTDLYFNDTSITPGTYYYSIKVCFIGYTDAISMTVDNYESTYFGEGSALLQPVPPPLTIDYIYLTDAPDGALLTLEVISILGSITVYASGYNSSTGLFVDLVNVDWSALPLGLGNFDNLTGTSTTFTAVGIAGSVNITGENLIMIPAVSDNFTIQILDLTVDYILITAWENGPELISVDLPIGGSITVFASGYNTTFAAYVSLVDVDWTHFPVLGSFTATPANQTTFIAGLVDGTTTITATNLSLLIPTDDFIVNILPPEADYIVITANDDGTSPLVTVDLPIGGSVTAYASGFNSTLGTFIRLVDVDWTESMALGSFAPTFGNQTIFTAGFVDGTTIVTAENTSLPTPTDDFTVNILPPTPDYIAIQDGFDGNNLTYEIIGVLGSITAYASGYNFTGNTYTGPVDVTWSAVPPGLGVFSPNPGQWTIFTGAGIAGIVNITGENLSMTPTVSDNFTLELMDLTVDYILITDGENGPELTTVDLPVGGSVTAFASGYNTTFGAYVRLVDVDWTNLPVLGTFTVTPANQTTFNAGLVDGTTTITATNLSLLFPTDDFIVNILPPTIDYIEITADDLGTTQLPDISVPVGFIQWGNCSAYNNTVLFLYTVSGTWTVEGGAATDLGTSPNVMHGIDVGLTPGFVWLNVSYFDGVTTHYDSVQYDVLTPTIDYIEITADDLGTTPLPDISVPVLFRQWGNCSAYNNTALFLYTVSGTWTVQGGSASDLGTSPNVMHGIDVDLTPGYVWLNVSYFDGVTTHYDSVQYDVLAPTIDYIEITADDLGTTPLPDISVPVGFRQWGNCSAYNNTVLFLYTVSAIWTVGGGSASDLGTSPNVMHGIDVGLMSVDVWLNASFFDGITTHYDSVQYTVLPPEVDYIVIMDEAGGIGNPIWVDWPNAEYSLFSVGDTYTYWAAGFNITTGGYVQDVSVFWNTTDIYPPLTLDTNNGTVVLGPSTSTTLTINSNHGGALFVVAENAGLGLYNTTDMIVIIPPMPDEIEIRDAPNRGGSIVTTRNYDVGQSDTFYAAGINYTAGYIGDVWVNWTISPPSGVGTVVLGPADSTTFDAVGAGTCTVTATNDTWGSSNVTGTLTVTSIGPTVSYIMIRDAADGLGNEVLARTYSVEDVDQFFAAAYDSGDVYLFDVEVTWSITPAGVGDIDITTGHQTNFTALEVSTDDTCTVTAAYGSLTDSTGVLTVLAPIVDYIQIRDASGGSGSIVTDKTYSVDQEDTFYAAAYNFTVDYLYDVSVTWESDADTVGQVTPTGDSTTFTAQQVDVDSQCNVTATYGTITNITGVLTVLYPRVDRIIIRDAPDDGGFIVFWEFLEVDNTSIYYAAGYNDTVDYLGDLVDAEWVISDGVGTVTTPGASTTFTATTDGTGTLTVSYTYDSITITDSATITVSEPYDPPPPRQDPPTVKAEGPDKIKVGWDPSDDPDVAGYRLIRATDPNDPLTWELVTPDLITTTSYTDKGLDPDTKYYYSVIAVDNANQSSLPSDWVGTTTEPEGFPWILLLLPIIIAIIVILLALLLWRKKKKEEEAKLPPEAAIPAAAPLEEAPPPGVPEEEYEYAPEEGYEEAPAEEYEEAPSEEYEEYEEAPSEEYEEETEFEEEPEEETPTPPPPPPPPPE